MADAELPDGAPEGVVVEGRQGSAAPRAAGTVHALDDVCSHAGALLSRGDVIDCVVTCPLHESQFDVRDGHIVRGPAHHPQPCCRRGSATADRGPRLAARAQARDNLRRNAMAWEAVADPTSSRRAT